MRTPRSCLPLLAVFSLAACVSQDRTHGSPDSGTPAAVGFARASGIPFSEGLIKNRYVGRTFIQPDQALREQGIRLKYNPLDEVAGKRVIAVDDSLVRGNTTRQIVAMLFDAGAAEVHIRVSSPPIVGPCFYGIDTPDRSELLASIKTLDEIVEFLDVDSLEYLTLDHLVQAIDAPGAGFCDACLTGNYPVPVPVEIGQRPALSGAASGTRA